MWISDRPPQQSKDPQVNDPMKRTVILTSMMMMYRKYLLTRCKVERLPLPAHRAPLPPVVDTPPPRRQGTAAPACCGFDSLGVSLHRRRPWSMAPIAPSRSADSLWAGRRTGQSAAAPVGCTSCEGVKTKVEISSQRMPL